MTRFRRTLEESLLEGYPLLEYRITKVCRPKESALTEDCPLVEAAVNEGDVVRESGRFLDCSRIRGFGCFDISLGKIGG